MFHQRLSIGQSPGNGTVVIQARSVKVECCRNPVLKTGLHVDLGTHGPLFLVCRLLRGSRAGRHGRQCLGNKEIGYRDSGGFWGLLVSSRGTNGHHSHQEKEAEWGAEGIGVVDGDQDLPKPLTVFP